MVIADGDSLQDMTRPPSELHTYVVHRMDGSTVTIEADQQHLLAPRDYGILYYFFHRKGSIVCTLRESDVKMVTSEHAKILEAPVTPARRITT